MSNDTCIPGDDHGVILLFLEGDQTRTYGPALTAPIGVIHWASTDTATYWSAYMEGAVDAGERAAQAVIVELAQ
jgi:monoamine oxidase